MDIKNIIAKTESETMAGLKDFQRATVERIDTLFRNGQNRVLVADEVGLGKTLIARGTIAKLAKLRVEEGVQLFKVVYICSNQNIANQNIKKLNIFHVNVEKASETRLSMQHLKSTEQEEEAKQNLIYVQLIPLTPETSFRMTSGGGSVSERALMFAILRRLMTIRNYIDELEDMMIYWAESAWHNRARDWYEQRVSKCEETTKGAYPKNILLDIAEYNELHGTIDILKEHLKCRRSGKGSQYKDGAVIHLLRIMFANISVGMLNPDFVIMDEFQRFKFLLQDENSETGILAKRFLSSDDNRILLLSATPYKLYSTLEEIEETNVDEHYSEFFDVMNFLFSDEKKESNFKKVWADYSMALHELKEGDTAIIAMKGQAEDAMYGGVCRTERISVMDSGDYIDDISLEQYLEINEYDIRSYLDMGILLRSINADFSLPVDYVKSCPFLMSYMRNYKVKDRIEKYFMAHPNEVKKAKKMTLWVDKNKINRYEPLPATNAKLEELKKQIFQNKSELYLWVPPSRPYYKMQGVYKDSEGFSKILVFSSWEMVPRMIGGLVSYEAERKTVGRLGKQLKNIDKKNAAYFADTSKRFPVARLRFHISQGSVRGMSLFCLLYPSKTLADVYQPISCMNRHMDLAAIEKEIAGKLKQKIDLLIKEYQKETSGREDDRWYYMAPILMDGASDALNWMNSIKATTSDEDDSTIKRGSKNFDQHLAKLKEYIESGDNIELGRIPDDLVGILTNMVLGSPAVCIYRSNGNNIKRASELAEVFVNRFNATEASAIVDLAYGRSREDSAHWKNVLCYCKDGNFQAMFDEYVHLLTEGTGFSNHPDMDMEIHEAMVAALKIHAASYTIDTYAAFKSRIEERGETKKRRVKGTNIRSQFAVGFTKSDGDDSQNVNRKDSIRNAFNSPLRPFVLATTSIGQEGLDFHNYCRKIMHWNLPSNPIDLEQREGRINRFKCLAIRQNIARKYKGLEYKKDIWNEMFEAAACNDKEDGQSELVPFWCLGKNQEDKIERIVPMYPVSRDAVKYERLIKVLSLYRLTLGQARQEELLEYIFKEFEGSENLKKLFIDLSPYSRETAGD